MRVCADTGCHELTDTTRCPAHTRAKDMSRGTRQQRGYDAAHDRLRARWARKVATGKVNCARCKKRISPLEAWHLDHTDDRTGYLGPSHALCNVSHAPISPDA
jgi:ribosomal protein L44E